MIYIWIPNFWMYGVLHPDSKGNNRWISRLNSQLFLWQIQLPMMPNSFSNEVPFDWIFGLEKIATHDLQFKFVIPFLP